MKNHLTEPAPRKSRPLFLLPLLLFALLVVPGVLTSSTVRGLVMRVPLVREGIDLPLNGVSIPEKKPHVGVKAWLSGAYQAQFTRWFGQNFGYRGLMVRADNQIGYSVFNKSNTPSAGIVVGRDKILHEEDYTLEYCSMVPQASDAQLERLAADLADVGARFRARGVGFVVYISPTKTAVYPETLPPAYLLQKTKAARAYERMLPLLQKHHINYVDGHAALMAAKAAYPAPQNPPLFSQGGIHYNDWGLLFAMQPLLSALEKEGGKPLPPLRHTYPVPTDYQPTTSDKDFALLINLLKPPLHYLSPHPALHFDHTRVPPQSAGRLSVIGGSFCWQPLQLLDENKVYEQMDFYYYYHTLLHQYPTNAEGPVAPDTLDWNQTFLRSEVVVLEINEEKFIFGDNNHFHAFLRDAKTHLAPPPAPRETRK